MPRPTLPELNVVPVPSIPVPKIRLPIFKVFAEVGDGVSML